MADSRSYAVNHLINFAVLQVYTLHEDTLPITGLIYEKFPTATRKHVVILTTSDRMYQFIGNVSDGEIGSFGELFRRYDLNPSMLM